MNFKPLLKKFTLSIISAIILIVVVLLKNYNPENKFISLLSYIALVNYIIVFIYEQYSKIILKKD